MGENPRSPHILIFPFPVQGHVNSMLKLAELLSLSGLKITFLNSKHNHNRLLRYTDTHVRFQQYPGFQFKTFPDGLPVDHPRSGDQAFEIFDSLNLSARPFLKEILIDTRPPVSCIIVDGIMGFVTDIANELKIQLIKFRTISASYIWLCFCIPEMIQAGHLSLPGLDEDMDRLIPVPGMETFLRYRDLPGFRGVHDISYKIFQLAMTETLKSPGADVLLLNTFEDLEGPILSQLRTKCRRIYTIGPLHLHLRTRLASKMKSSQSSNSLFEVDRSCMAWLDEQPLRSVIYVSFGSNTVLTREQYMEFWYGLVNSKQRFLWVIRPGSIDGEGESPMELLEGTKERGYIVGWAPQEEVLAHKAVGGFLTHNGWNSTLESIAAGVPMICWPCFGDQQVNSRLVSEFLKVGLDMMGFDREVVEKMVKDLMVVRRKELVKSTDTMTNLAKKCVSDSGSSSCNLDRLIDDLHLMGAQVNEN